MKKAVKHTKRKSGSKLKTAVTKKPSSLKEDQRNKRRKSFCSRMKGMKKRLTLKTDRDPDSRINKALEGGLMKTYKNFRT